MKNINTTHETSPRPSPNRHRHLGTACLSAQSPMSAALLTTVSRRAMRSLIAPRAAPLTRPCFRIQSRQHGDHSLDGPGDWAHRDTGAHGEWDTRDWSTRALTVGIGGPVGSGKTALTLALCRSLRERRSLGVVTNDIFTREDCEFLTRNEALPAERIRAVETGGCPHAAIR